MSQKHTVTARFDGDGCRPLLRLTCDSSPDALCRAEFECECEQYFDSKVVDGKPTHRPDWDSDETHVGSFGTGCNIATWFDVADGEELTGTVSFEIAPEWQGEFYTYAIEDRS